MLGTEGSETNRTQPAPVVSGKGSSHPGKYDADGKSSNTKKSQRRSMKWPP